jgi:aryl-alcohol dehydrogenase-like predicted oxidoreductase
MDNKHKNGSRREFLKAGVSGLAGMAILPTVAGVRSEAYAEEATKEKPTLIHRKLGKTGLELPIVSMGVMNADTPALVEAALDAGIVHLDTAHAYQRGRNEEMIGGVIKGRDRDSFVVSTKVQGNGLDRKTGTFTEKTKAAPFVEDFETSLERLGLDYVDILYLHSVVTREAVLFEEFLTTMEKLKKEGKTRFIGVSTHRNEPEVIRAAIEGKSHDVVLTAYNFLQPHADEVEKAMAEASKAGLGVVAMKTQAGVYFDKERQEPINMKAALKWVLKNENVHTSIPGFNTFDQMNDDLSVMADLPLTPDEREDLQLGLRSGAPGLFCDQCGDCLTQCGKGVDVPTLMRGYMYAYGYKSPRTAKDALASVDLGNLACATCDDCTVTCRMKFDVRQRAEDIARIRSVPEDFLV